MIILIALIGLVIFSALAFVTFASLKVSKETRDWEGEEWQQ